MKKFIAFLVISIVSISAVAAAGDKEPPATKKISEFAKLTCMLPKPDGTIVCHITALDSKQGGSYDCDMDTHLCHEGYWSALKPGQTCLGAIVCRPATPKK